MEYILTRCYLGPFDELTSRTPSEILFDRGRFSDYSPCLWLIGSRYIRVGRTVARHCSHFSPTSFLLNRLGGRQTYPATRTRAAAIHSFSSFSQALLHFYPLVVMHISPRVKSVLAHVVPFLFYREHPLAQGTSSYVPSRGLLNTRLDRTSP